MASLPRVKWLKHAYLHPYQHTYISISTHLQAQLADRSHDPTLPPSLYPSAPTLPPLPVPFCANWHAVLFNATCSVVQVMQRAEWDEEQEAWQLQRLSGKQVKRPISTPHHRRPLTAYAQAAAALGDHNPRYKTDNILALALDMPDRTTADYSGSHAHTQVSRHSGVQHKCCSML